MAWRRVGSFEVLNSSNEGFAIFDCAGRSFIIGFFQKKMYCIENLCSHQGRRMDEGHLSEGCFQCPHHVVRFNILDGGVKFDGGFLGLSPCSSFPVKEVGGEIFVDF